MFRTFCTSRRGRKNVIHSFKLTHTLTFQSSRHPGPTVQSNHTYCWLTCHKKKIIQTYLNWFRNYMDNSGVSPLQNQTGRSLLMDPSSVCFLTIFSTFKKHLKWRVSSSARKHKNEPLAIFVRLENKLFNREE